MNAFASEMNKHAVMQYAEWQRRWHFKNVCDPLLWAVVLGFIFNCLFFLLESEKEEILTKCGELLPLCYLWFLAECEKSLFFFVKSIPLHVAH
jgi:hypothetical protein